MRVDQSGVGPPEDPHRGEALRVLLERMLVEVCPVRRADPTLSETHWLKAVQVSSMQQVVLKKRPSVTAHEKTLREVIHEFCGLSEPHFLDRLFCKC